MAELLDPSDQPRSSPAGGTATFRPAEADGVELVGLGGLLSQLIATVLETALKAEWDDYPGCRKHQVEAAIAEICATAGAPTTRGPRSPRCRFMSPRDNDALLEPQIIEDRQRRPTLVDGIFSSLSAKDLTSGEIAAHLDDVYGATVPKETTSRPFQALCAGRYRHR